MPVRRSVPLVEIKGMEARDRALDDCIQNLINRLWYGKIRPPLGNEAEALGPREVAASGYPTKVALIEAIEKRGWRGVNVHNAQIVNREYEAQVNDMMEMRSGTYGAAFADLWSADRWRSQDQNKLNQLYEQIAINKETINYAKTIDDEWERQEYLFDEFFLPMLTAGSALNPGSAWMCEPQILMNYMQLGYQLNSWEQHKDYMVDSLKESAQEFMEKVTGAGKSVLPYVAVGALGLFLLSSKG